MQHPDPLHLCRHVRLIRLPDGRKQCLFRRNSLNPPTAWDAPVPRLGTALIFDNFVAPLEYYLPALEATAHHPADTHPFDIIPSGTSGTSGTSGGAHVLTLADPLRELNPRGAGGVSGLGGAEYQARLKDMRDTLVCNMVHKYMEQGEVLSSEQQQPPLKLREVADRAIAQVAPRIRLSPASIWKILRKREGFTTAPDRKPRKPPAPPAPLRLSTAHEYLHKYKRLCAVVQIARSNDPELGVFSIHHLAVSDAPGGYPTHCPVSGVELDWGGDPSSLVAPKLALRSVLCMGGLGLPSTLPASQDVLLVSKVAKRILEGTGSVTTLARFMAGRDHNMLAMRRWLDNNNASDKALDNLRKVIAAVNDDGE